MDGITRLTQRACPAPATTLDHDSVAHFDPARLRDLYNFTYRLMAKTVSQPSTRVILVLGTHRHEMDLYEDEIIRGSRAGSFDQSRSPFTRNYRDFHGF